MNLTIKNENTRFKCVETCLIKIIFILLSILGAVFENENENSESDINDDLSSKHIIFSLKYFRFFTFQN